MRYLNQLRTSLLPTASLLPPLGCRHEIHSFLFRMCVQHTLPPSTLYVYVQMLHLPTHLSCVISANQTWHTKEVASITHQSGTGPEVGSALYSRPVTTQSSWFPWLPGPCTLCVPPFQILNPKCPRLAFSKQWRLPTCSCVSSWERTKESALASG